MFNCLQRAQRPPIGLWAWFLGRAQRPPIGLWALSLQRAQRPPIGLCAWFCLPLALSVPACAEIHTLTLRQAIDRALVQNPEVVMARMDEAKASHGVRVAQDPF